MNKTITRSTVNNEQYSAQEFPKSGFNLSYRDYNDYMLGRWHVSGYQWIMPSDKFSGHNKGNFTFNRIVTPMVAPVHVGQYNVFVTLRSIDNTFQENVAPSKYNGYSADWSMPMINTRSIVDFLVTEYYQYLVEEWYNEEDNPVTGLDTIIALIQFISNNHSGTLDDFFGSTDAYGDFSTFEQNLAQTLGLAFYNSQFLQDAKNLYFVDVLADIREFWESRFGKLSYDRNSRQYGLPDFSETMTIQEFLYNFLDCLLTPFVGRYSYYADFGYNFVRPSDIYRIANGDVDVSSGSFVSLFDDTPCCEYPIRAMYAFWYDRCRDVNLQPVSSTLPNPRKFGSQSVVSDCPLFLVYRIRRWTEDMFISAMCDSPAKHVYAPIYNQSVNVDVTNKTNSYEHAQTEDPYIAKPLSYDIEFVDSITGNSRSVTCPVPSFVNDLISRSAISELDDTFALLLPNLRQAQNLERYLKRLDYFGDEYNDYMLAQYNSRVSDLRINHPEVLSQSIDDANYEQEIANMSNGISNAGDRTATGTLSSSGDGYTSFAEEFGIVINVISFMPDSTYDGINPQLLMNKLVDLPLPIFAANNDEVGRIMEIASKGLANSDSDSDSDTRYMFGHYPAYHAWRSRVDRARGSFLNERQDCLFRRFFGLTALEDTPRLNYEFINCRPSLQMFANTVRYDCQLYGDVIHEFYVERVLPTPVESI